MIALLKMPAPPLRKTGDKFPPSLAPRPLAQPTVRVFSLSLFISLYPLSLRRFCMNYAKRVFVVGFLLVLLAGCFNPITTEAPVSPPQQQEDCGGSWKIGISRGAPAMP
jgi:hypothetical protein